MLHRRLLPAVCLALAACSVPGDVDPDELDSDDLADAGSESGDAPEPAAPPSPRGSIAADGRPEEVLDGIPYDDPTSVLVLNANNTDACSGTLVRNDVVLTARHCVTVDESHDGTLASPSQIHVYQDQPGDAVGPQVGVVSVWGHEGLVQGPYPFQLPDPMNGEIIDIALLRLVTSLPIDGHYHGESVELTSRDDDDGLVGDLVLCSGFGQQSCQGTVGPLRAGFARVAGIDPDNGHVDYTYFDYSNVDDESSNWLPSPGDSGSSCRIVNAAWQTRLIGVLSVGTVCTTLDPAQWQASAVRPRYVRAWAEPRIAEWDGDVFSDPFAAIQQPHEVVEPPITGTAPIWSTWAYAGNYRLVQLHNGYQHDATTQEGTKYIYDNEVIADGTIGVTVSGGSGPDGAAGIIARMRDEEHYYRFAVDEDADVATIVVRKGSSFVELGSAPLPSDFRRSTRIELQLFDKTLKGYVDGALVLSVTDDDATYLSGRAGMYTYELDSAHFDDFELDRYDWDPVPIPR